MKYVYFAVLCCAAFFCCVVAGMAIGSARCNARAANANVRQVVVNTNIQRDTDEKVFHTATYDIRRILREKYTIAE